MIFSIRKLVQVENIDGGYSINLREVSCIYSLKWKETSVGFKEIYVPVFVEQGNPIILKFNRNETVGLGI